MSNPAPAPTSIPRQQFALYVRDDQGHPIEKLIQDLEEQQEFVLTGLPAAVAVAQATADAAQLRLNTASFLTVGADALVVPQSRQITAGTRIRLTDAGAGAGLTIGVSDQIVTLPADVSDNTAAFVNAVGLVGALLANSVYMVEGLLTFQSASLVVGIGLGFTLPAGATINGSYNHNATVTTLQGAYNNAAGAVSGNTTAVPVINDNTPINGRWIIRTAAAAGNAQLQFRTSTAATLVTLKQSLSILNFQKIG